MSVLVSGTEDVCVRVDWAESSGYCGRSDSILQLDTTGLGPGGPSETEIRFGE